MNQDQESLAPFSCKYTPQIPELLQRLNCSIAISTYQAGKLVFISAKDEHQIVQLPRNFNKVMGINYDSETDRIALACKDEILVCSNSPDLAANYPKAPNTYDALFMPRVTYHTGQLDIHDLSFGANGKLYAVNTLFSCISEIDEYYNFKEYWRPWFVSEMVSEDRCHLNGMCLADGKPKYATAFNQGDSMQSWRKNVTSTGILIDIEKNEIILEGLAMPHTPRIFNSKLYVLLSATGELIEVDTKTKSYKTVVSLNGFVRGMACHKDYLFIGLSKLRQNSSTFGKLKFAEKANRAGIMVVHLPTGSVAGEITYLTSLDEIYDVEILPGYTRPNILNTMTDIYSKGLMTPEATFWSKMES